MSDLHDPSTEVHGGGEGYQPVMLLGAPEGAVNGLAFNDGATLLASGGDDEEVRVWEMKGYSCIQKLAHPQKHWGQITSIQFVDLDLNGTGNTWLVFGTGRGRLVLCKRSRRVDVFQIERDWKIFSQGDSVESFAIEGYSQLVAVASHHGSIRLYRLEGQEMVFLWGDTELGAIPRRIAFSDRGATILVYGMESGTIWCRDTETSKTVYTKRLKTAIGDVAFCHNSDAILIDNMHDGYDLYTAGRIAPTKSFPVALSQKFIKASAFAEKGKVAVCGSDHGKVYVFAVAKAQAAQILKIGGRDHVIQAVAAASSNNYHFIAAAASTGAQEIKLWRKDIRSRPVRGQRPQEFNMQLLFNILLVALVATLTKDSWLSQEHYLRARGAASVAWTKAVYAIVPQPNLKTMSPGVLAEIIHTLDDESVRKIFGMGPKLTEAELLEGVTPDAEKME